MSETIFLKEPGLDDIKFIQWLWADPETMAQVGGPIILSDQEAAAWHKRMISPGSDTDCYRLIIREDNNPVGEVSYHRMDREKMTAELNIKIAARYRGHGYARTALILFLDHYFNQKGGKILQDRVSLNNNPGKDFLLDFGFTLDPSIKDVLFFRLDRDSFNRRYQISDLRGSINPP